MLKLVILNIGGIKDMPIKIGRKKFYNVETLAKMLFVPVQTVRLYIRRGRIKALKVGRRYLISEEALEAFLNGEGDKR
jgi:excisionase family DNA binding protein